VTELRAKCPPAEFVTNNWGWTPSMMRALLEAGITCNEVMSDNAHAPSYHFFKKANDVVISRFPLPDNPDANAVLVDYLREVYEKAMLLLETEVVGNNFADDFSFLVVHATLRVSSCPWAFFNLALKLYPEQTLKEDKVGELPLHLAAAASSLSDCEFYKCTNCHLQPINGTRYHYKANRSQVYCHDCIVNNDWNVINYHEVTTCKKGPAAIEELLSLCPTAAKIPNTDGRLPLNIALDHRKYWDTGVKSLFEITPESICVRDIGTHMFPFMVCAAMDKESMTSRKELSMEDHLGKFTTIYALMMEAPHLLDARFRRRNS